MAPTADTYESTQTSRKHRAKQRQFRDMGVNPMQKRGKAGENYDKPVSGREEWWRSTIKETPVPGRYETHEDGFVRELERRPNTYGFRTDGRRRNPTPQIGRGEALLPGAYEHEDLSSRVNKFRETYGFRNSTRDTSKCLDFGRKDKDINISPDAYIVEKYMCVPSEKHTSKDSVFRSQSQRFPTVQFKPKLGPAPGSYHYDSPEALHKVSSSFQSKTPRFSTSHTKYPGPGMYDMILDPREYSSVQKLERTCGIFFKQQFV